MADWVAPGKQTFVDAVGVPLVGGLLWHYEPGTDTLKNTWQDEAQVSLNTNPIVLDGRGQASIWGIGLYRQRLTDAAGNAIWDRVTGVGQSQFGDDTAFYNTIADGRAANIPSDVLAVYIAGYRAAGDLGGALYVRTVTPSGQFFISADGASWQLSTDRPTPFHFGAHGDGVTNDTPAFQAALQAYPTVYVPFGPYYLATPIQFDQGYQLIGDGSMRSMLGQYDAAVLMPATCAITTAHPLNQLVDATIQGLGFQGGTTQVDLGLFHDVTVADCEFRGFTVAGLCIVRGEKQRLDRLRFDFTVNSQWGLCFGYEASIWYVGGLYAGQNPVVFFGPSDAFADRVVGDQIYFQAGAAGTWTVAAITSRLWGGSIMSGIVMHGLGAGDGKLVDNKVRLQQTTFLNWIIDSINTAGAAAVGFELPWIKDCAFIGIQTDFAGNSHFTKAFEFTTIDKLLLLNCSAGGDNITEFGFYLPNTAGTTPTFIGCSGSIYSAGVSFIPYQINLIACSFAVSNLPTKGHQQIDLSNTGFMEIFMADANGAVAATSARRWRFAIGLGTFSEPVVLDVNGLLINNNKIVFGNIFGTRFPQQLCNANGSPEGIVTASPGSLCMSYTGAASGNLYVKETGAGNTGWVIK